MNRNSRGRQARKLVPVVALLLLAAGAVALRGPLVRWFGLDAVVERSIRGSSAPGAAALDATRRAMDAYEEVRAQLAADGIDRLEGGAHAIAEALRAAVDATGDGDPAATPLRQATAAADHLAHQTDIDAARRAFADLSYGFIALAAGDPRLQEGWHIFRCPMTPGFGKWFQRMPPLENPYMGAAMLRCGGASTWEVAAADAPASFAAAVPAHRGDEPAFYTCPMHPSVRQKSAGACPICGMDLVAVTWDEQQSGVVRVDAVRRQEIGVRTATVLRAPLQRTIRAVGRVTYDETQLYDISLKQSGWVVRLDVNATGQHVDRGQSLFTLFSPELHAAQREYLVALRNQAAALGSGASASAETLLAAAQQRLRLWGVDDGEILRVARAGKPLEELAFVSPATGYVVEKDIVAGGAVDAGRRLYRIAALDRVWVEADVYESDVAAIRVGKSARIRFPDRFGGEIETSVVQVLPFLDEATRTMRVRLELDNPEHAFKPGMFADVLFTVELGERLQVPAEAVVVAGPRQLVFVDLGEGRLRPQEVTLGVRGGDAFEVLGGLDAGDTVVTSGNFLIAAESRLRSATQYWGGDGHGAH